MALDHGAVEAAVATEGVTDVLIFPGDYDLSTVLGIIGRRPLRVHIDVAYNVNRLDLLRSLGRAVSTLILSTSSMFFVQTFGGSVQAMKDAALGGHSDALLFKENRGGARLFTRDGGCIDIPAYVRPVLHSVGVGDCFNAVYVALRQELGDALALRYSSAIAAEYGATSHDNTFKEGAEAVRKIPSVEMAMLQGVSLRWEDRQSVSLYIAAPDFATVDRNPLERLVEALQYHNFKPQLPVRENGELPPRATPEQRRAVFDADLRLLTECSLVVAVMLYDDPGTLVEIGMAAERGMPVIVYDPFGIVRNPMVTESAAEISTSLDVVIGAVFREVGRIVAAPATR